jgi:thiamine biosynthesis lipoprotein ApbE
LIRSIASTAAEADALSTAFFVMSRDEVEEHCLARPDNVALFAVNNAQGIPATFDIPHSNGQISWQEREELPQ